MLGSHTPLAPGVPLQSAAKVPILLAFLCRQRTTLPHRVPSAYAQKKQPLSSPPSSSSPSSSSAPQPAPVANQEQQEKPAAVSQAQALALTDNAVFNAGLLVAANDTANKQDGGNNSGSDNGNNSGKSADLASIELELNESESSSDCESDEFDDEFEGDDDDAYDEDGDERDDEESDDDDDEDDEECRRRRLVSRQASASSAASSSSSRKSSSKAGVQIFRQACIFKVNDDIRQDVLSLQVLYTAARLILPHMRMIRQLVCSRLFYFLFHSRVFFLS
jgi:hypothetical protein